MRALYTVLLLIMSNAFMTLAWYGHLKFKEYKWAESLTLISVILISWGIAFFEYHDPSPSKQTWIQKLWRSVFVGRTKSYPGSSNASCIRYFFTGLFQDGNLSMESFDRLHLPGSCSVFYL